MLVNRFIQFLTWGVVCLLHRSWGENISVKTSLGTYIGEHTTLKDGGAVRIFRGVQFATANRWANPVLMTRFEGNRSALAFGPSCPNVCTGGTNASEPSGCTTDSGTPLCHTCSTRNVDAGWDYLRFCNATNDAPYPFFTSTPLSSPFELVLLVVPNDEECLFMNIMTPPDAMSSSNLPVAVFVHGGGGTGAVHNAHIRCRTNRLWDGTKARERKRERERERERDVPSPLSPSETHSLLFRRTSVGWAGIYTNTSALASKGVVYVSVQYRLVMTVH
jgi:hypothetical protein